MKTEPVENSDTAMTSGTSPRIILPVIPMQTAKKSINSQWFEDLKRFEIHHGSQANEKSEGCPA